MKYGLKQNTINQINKIFANYKQVEKVVLYGSRAKGNYRPNSDIDLTVFGADVDLKIINDISWEIDDLLLPYTFDISIFHHISQQDLLEHIQRIGLVFYENGRD